MLRKSFYARPSDETIYITTYFLARVLSRKKGGLPHKHCLPLLCSVIDTIFTFDYSFYIHTLILAHSGQMIPGKATVLFN